MHSRCFGGTSWLRIFLWKFQFHPTHIIYGTKLAFLYFSAKYWKNFSFSLTGFTLSAYHVLHDFNISLWKGTNFKVAIIGCAILYVGTILSLSVSLSHPITLLRTCSYIQNGHSGHTAITITLILMTELLLWLCVINTLSFDCLCFNSLSQDQ